MTSPPSPPPLTAAPALIEEERPTLDNMVQLVPRGKSGEPSTLEEFREQLLPKLREALRDRFGEIFKGIEYYCDGGTGICYDASFELPPSMEGQDPVPYYRQVKVDKPAHLITRGNALRHIMRGYQVRHELQTLEDLAGTPGIIVADPINLKPFGHDGLAKVEKKLDALSLEEMVEQYGPLSYHQFKGVFSQITGTEQTLIEDRGYFHRDLKPSNILVNPVTLQTWLIDFGNAGKKDDLEAKVSPTAGGHFIMDPITVAGFTKETPQYSDQSEIYANAVDAFYALTGVKLFEYDYATWAELAAVAITPAQALETGYWNYHDEKGVRRGINHKGESLLDEQGNLSIKAHQRTLRKGKRLLKGKKKRLWEYLYSGMTVKKKERFTSYEESKKAYDYAIKPTLGEHLKRNWPVYASGFLALAAFGALGVKEFERQHERWPWEVAQERVELQYGVDENGNIVYPHQVTPKANGDDISIGTTIFDEVKVKIWGKKDLKYEERPFFHANPGERILISIDAIDAARPHLQRFSYNWTVEGAVYFEGYEKDPISTTVQDFDRAPRTYYGMHAGYGEDGGMLTVPETDQEVLRLAVELYAPTGVRRAGLLENQMIDMPPGGGVIYRKVIPVILSDRELPFTIDSARFMTDGFIDMGTDENKSVPTEYLIDIPEIRGWSVEDEGCGRSDRINFLGGMPYGLPDGLYTMRIKSFQEGELVDTTYIPLKPSFTSPNADERKHIWWEVAIPDSTWGERLEAIRLEQRELIPYKQWGGVVMRDRNK